MTEKFQNLTCDDLDKLFVNSNNKPTCEVIRIIKWSQKHIPECKRCSEKYDTMGTVVKDVFAKSKNR